MTRPEAVAAASEAGLAMPRIIPHSGKSGVVWHLYHGPADDRRAITLPVNVDKKRLHEAIENASGEAQTADAG